MSIDDYDYGYGDWLENLYREFSKEVLSGGADLYDEVIVKFTSERVQSYYVANPKLAERSLWALSKARTLRRHHPDASLVLAVTAAEVGLNSCLLKPILHGLVHDNAMAMVIAELVPEQRNLKFRDLLFGILQKYGGIDLQVYKRAGITKTLWEELKEIQKLRNLVVHRAEAIATADAKKAFEIASLIIETLFPAVITKLGLRTNDKLEVLIKKP